MDFVLTLGTAATATSLLVAIFKFGYPAAPSWAVALVALLAGIGLSFLVALGQADVFTNATIAQSVLAGIFAAAAAAGVSQTNQAAEVKRTLAQQQEQMKVD